MDANVEDAMQYVEDVGYPASKEEVAAGAREKGAPEDLIKRLQALPTPDFSGPGEVITELRAAPTSG